MTVIMVENSRVMQQVWRDMIDRIADLTLIGIYSGAPAAIAAVRSMPPDIVLLDIQLDEGSGIDVLRVLAAEHADARVIVVSSEKDDVYRRFCANAGAYAYYDKNELTAIHHTLASLANLKSSDAVVTGCVPENL